MAKSNCDCTSCLIVSMCCSRLSDGYEIDAPHVMLKESQALSKLLNRATEDFLYPMYRENYNYFKIKTSKGRCIFSCNGKCNIYDNRPLDCRLFPFDIRHMDSKTYWILYPELCSGICNLGAAYDAAKETLKESGASSSDIILYARDISNSMRANKFVTLEEIQLN